jgi:DNA-binding transcriptional regulator PaaX
MNHGTKRQLGATAQKILLLLTSGIAIGLCGNPNTCFRIIRETRREWEFINDRALRNNIRNLNTKNYIKFKKTSGNNYIPVVTREGAARTLIFSLNALQIPPQKSWDGTWKIVVFDIPEALRKKRRLLAKQLIRLGLYRLQKSVFIHPYPCKDQVEKIIQAYRIHAFVHYLVAKDVDKISRVKKFFQSYIS